MIGDKWKMKIQRAVRTIDLYCYNNNNNNQDIINHIKKL